MSPLPRSACTMGHNFLCRKAEQSCISSWVIWVYSSEHNHYKPLLTAVYVNSWTVKSISLGTAVPGQHGKRGWARRAHSLAVPQPTLSWTSLPHQQLGCTWKQQSSGWWWPRSCCLCPCQPPALGCPEVEEERGEGGFQLALSSLPPRDIVYFAAARIKPSTTLLHQVLLYLFTDIYCASSLLFLKTCHCFAFRCLGERCLLLNYVSVNDAMSPGAALQHKIKDESPSFLP